MNIDCCRDYSHIILIKGYYVLLFHGEVIVFIDLRRNEWTKLDRNLHHSLCGGKNIIYDPKNEVIYIHDSTQMGCIDIYQLIPSFLQTETILIGFIRKTEKEYGVIFPMELTSMIQQYLLDLTD